MAKKICSSCGRIAFCSYRGQKCILCARRKDHCVNCKIEKWIYTLSGLCENCDQNRHVRKHLEKLETTLKPKSEYNKYLFDLYLKYLRRFHLDVIHLQQTKNFMQLLESRDFFAFKSWEEIQKESDAFKFTYGKKLNSGCPFIKTGRMLEELGAIDFRQKDIERYLSQKISKLSSPQKKHIEPFLIFLKTTHRSKNTLTIAVAIVISFSRWLSERGCHDLMNASINDISSFLDEEKSKNKTQYRIIQIYGYLNFFYRWSLSEKRCLFNPCKGVKVSKPSPRLNICSDEQCQNLFKFIRNDRAHPEQAFLIALILIWSLSSEDLRFAKIEFNKTLTITFHRHRLNFKKYYNREQILQLPDHPKWFYNLQIRFYKDWITQYQKLKKSVPHQYLLLPKRRHVQPVTKSTLRHKITQATQTAVGNEIPPLVLRKTSGYLHSRQGEASILATLGWSKEHCFDYTWVPKVVYCKKHC